MKIAYHIVKGKEIFVSLCKILYSRVASRIIQRLALDQQQQALSKAAAFVLPLFPDETSSEIPFLLILFRFCFCAWKLGDNPLRVLVVTSWSLLIQLIPWNSYSETSEAAIKSLYLDFFNNVAEEKSSLATQREILLSVSLWFFSYLRLSVRKFMQKP